MFLLKFTYHNICFCSHNKFVEVDIMEQNKEWLKFIITGKINNYLNYKSECQKNEICGGEYNSNFDRRPCDKRNELR